MTDEEISIRSVYGANNQIEADFLRSELEAAGVIARVVQPDSLGAGFVYPMTEFVRQPEIWVRSDQFEEAREIVITALTIRTCASDSQE